MTKVVKGGGLSSSQSEARIFGMNQSESLIWVT